MHAIIMIEPSWQLLDDSAGVGAWADAGVIALECADERLCHSVALRAFDRRGSRDQADVAGEAPGIVRGVAAAVVGQPFDGVRQGVHLAEAMFDRGHHEISHIFGGYPSSRGDVAHRLPIAAVEREGDADLFAIVAADLEAVGAPACISGGDSDTAVMPPFRTATGMTLQQQAMQLHDAVDAFWIGRCAPVFLRFAAQQRMDASIAIGWQVGDQPSDVGESFCVRQWRATTTAPFSRPLHR